MTDPKTDQTPDPEGADDESAKKSLFDAQLEPFQKGIEADPEEGLARFGFSLFHSLPPEDSQLFRGTIGLENRTAPEFYNTGVAHALKEDYKSAIDCWRRALSKDSELIDAHFNIALAHERLDDLTKARKYFKRYLEAVEDPEEKEAVEEHLAQLGN